MSEFFALVFKNEDGTPVEGIRYPSAVHPSGRNLVIFPTRRGVMRAFGTVKFEKSTMKTIKVKDEPKVAC